MTDGGYVEGTGVFCVECNNELWAFGTDNRETWGPDWKEVDPLDLTLTCMACQIVDQGHEIGTRKDDAI